MSRYRAQAAITPCSYVEETNDKLVAQDGIPRYVSKTVMCRMMWRRFNAFVTCKNCGGRPIPRVGRSSVATGQPGASGQDASEVRKELALLPSAP